VPEPGTVARRQRNRQKEYSEDSQAAPKATMAAWAPGFLHHGHRVTLKDEAVFGTGLGLAQSSRQTPKRMTIPIEDPIAKAEDMIAAGQPHQAALELRNLLAASRGGALARITLVNALIASGDVEGALAEAREAVSLNPGLPGTLVALGRALLAAENLPAAIGELQRALRLDPDHDEARFLTGRAWAEAGEAEKALAIFDQLDAGMPGLSVWRAKAEGMRSAARSDPGYVRHLFDQFSADYDRRMRTELSYAAPEILGDLADMIMPGRQELVVLDLGCGTGLAGAVFRGRARRLDGIDLSPAMVEKAREKNLYDHLAVGDIETALSGLTYDLVIAADTLVYLGDLSPLMRRVRAHLAGDGYFLFTVEAADEGFSLGPKRRWRHSEVYLRQLAAEAGFLLAGLVAASPRQENGEPVTGFAVGFAAA
jgi:predicted TPR repeat methyltransferase